MITVAVLTIRLTVQKTTRRLYGEQEDLFFGDQPHFVSVLIALVLSHTIRMSRISVTVNFRCPLLSPTKRIRCYSLLLNKQLLFAQL